MTSRPFRIVAVSPGDVSEERKAVDRVVKSVNQGLARSLGLDLKLWRWETDSHPALHLEGPQGVIDDLMDISQSDLVIGIFWKRFGTPTHDADSGTEHELLKAYASWMSQGRPQLMLYFNKARGHPTSGEGADQWKKVLDFQEQISNAGLLGSYNGARDFERVFRDQLEQFLLHYQQPQDQTYGIFDVPTFADAIPRTQLWSEIEDSFQKHPVVAIGGLPGSGKTYLMSSFTEARITPNTRTRPFWHDPSQGESLDSLFAALGGQISLPGSSMSSRCKSLIAFLRRQKTLLIIDNFHTVDQQTYSLLLELFARAGTPCRLVLLTQTFVVPQITAPDIYHVSVPGFALDEAQRLLKHRGLREFTNDVLSDLLEKTGGLPFAISLFAVLVGHRYGFEPAELLSGTMARDKRINDWFNLVRAGIDAEARQLLPYLSLTDSPFNRGVVRMLAHHVGATTPDQAFEQLQSHYLVGTHSPYRWKVHDLVASLSSSSLDTDARNKGHSALGRYFLSGLPQKPNAILTEEQFVWKVRAFRHLKSSNIEDKLTSLVLEELASTTKAQGHYAMFLELSADAMNSQPERNKWIDYHHAHCAFILGYNSYCLSLMKPLLDSETSTSDNQRLAFTRLYAEALGSMGEERSALERLKAVLDSIRVEEVNPVTYTQARSICVWLLTRLEDYTEASKRCDELLAEAERLKDERGGAVAFTRKGSILLSLGFPREAADLFTTAVQLFRQAGDRRGGGWSLAKLAECQLLEGDEVGALRTFKDASVIKSDIGECSVEYRESIVRMKSKTKSKQLVQLLDDELQRLEMATRFDRPLLSRK